MSSWNLSACCGNSSTSCYSKVSSNTSSQYSSPNHSFDGDTLCQESTSWKEGLSGKCVARWWKNNTGNVPSRSHLETFAYTKNLYLSFFFKWQNGTYFPNQSLYYASPFSDLLETFIVDISSKFFGSTEITRQTNITLKERHKLKTKKKQNKQQSSDVYKLEFIRTLTR